MPEVIRCALLCMPEVAEGMLCSLEVLKVQWCGGCALFAGGAAGTSGNTRRATLYDGGCGGYALFAGGAGGAAALKDGFCLEGAGDAGSDKLRATPYAAGGC